MHVEPLQVPAGSGQTFGPFKHAAIIYREQSASKELFTLDFSAEGKIERKPPARLEKYAWAVPAAILPPMRRQVAHLCDYIANHNHKFPYGIKDSDASVFIPDGSSVALGTGCIGFTCATFVLAVFRRFGIYLLDAANWVHRDADRAWQKSIADLQAAIGTPAYIVAANRADAAV